MKRLYKSIIFAVVAVAGFGITSCTDPLRFGNEFLEKAPGGTVTADTVFSNAEYTRQFLTSIYSKQYYGLPCDSKNAPLHMSYWRGMTDCLSDTFHLFSANTVANTMYYGGALTAVTGNSLQDNIYPFCNENIWENVRRCYLLLENIDNVPGLGPEETERMKDEARCLLVNTYFVAFRFYGGLPIIKGTFVGDEASYNYPRASIEESVEFMVGLLDTVIDGNHLPWGYTGVEAQTETGRWSLAGAMALKCKILQFVASPLFNSDKPYFDGKYTIEDPYVAWYGNYDVKRWEAFRDACKDFLDKMNENPGVYHLVEPNGTSAADYRYAFRSSYLLQGSPEVIMGIRVSKKAEGGDYGWINLRNNPRMSYCPTQEYVEMFPWADGRPFDWDKLETEGCLDTMFVKGDTVANKQMLQNRVLTRDPRLYETVAVNGALQTINWGDGKTSGANYELWVGGTTAGMHPINQDDHYGTGYRYLKYYAGEAFVGKYPHWVWLSLGEIYLGYAEALVQTGGDLKEAVKYVDAMRARVGLGGLVECNPDKDLLNDREALLEEILRERACEFAFNDSRYFDLIRYKRADLFERPLHRLLIYRLVRNESGEWVRSETQWYNDRTSAEQGTPEYYEPSRFDYEKAEITAGKRYWWENGFDPKWYLQPFPVKELEKDYGLIQNAGW